MFLPASRRDTHTGAKRGSFFMRGFWCSPWIIIYHHHYHTQSWRGEIKTKLPNGIRPGTNNSCGNGQSLIAWLHFLKLPCTPLDVILNKRKALKLQGSISVGRFSLFPLVSFLVLNSDTVRKWIPCFGLIFCLTGLSGACSITSVPYTIPMGIQTFTSEGVWKRTLK